VIDLYREPNNTTVIIRASGERTLALCEKLISEQGIGNEHIFTVAEVPFSATMKKSFELGIANKLPWTFCVDADVLLRPGSVEHMVRIAAGQPENVCEIQGMMLDKFFGGPRPGGIHLYRTSLLPEVLKRVPDEGTDIRPEFHTLKKMEADGYPFVKVPYVVGVHDYEQYNFDIYRKCFVHAVKHMRHADMLIAIWKDHAAHDTDFKIALKAFSDSIHNTMPAYINSRQKMYMQLFELSGFHEKDDLDATGYTAETIESIIADWKEPEAYMKKFPTRWGLDTRGIMPKVKQMINERGVARTLVFLTGKTFAEIGNSLMTASNRKKTKDPAVM
jgi:hypothetical protein